MIATTYRYQLPKKAIKSDCPECGPIHHNTLSRYVDSQTGELLPEIYGRCDRESNCGYHLSPYTKGSSGNSYAIEVSQTNSISHHWFKMVAKSKRNHVLPESIVTTLMQMEGATQQQAEQVVKKVFSRATSSTLATSEPQTIPHEICTKSLAFYAQNQLTKLLQKHFGIEVANQLLKRFQIGTSKYWNNAGACVFWLIDEQGRVRGGQIKLFDEDFHTVKYTDRSGEKRSRTSWVHTALDQYYSKRQQPQPDWLTAYIKQAEFAPCLFGLPQLQTAPIDQPIAIVEAPKTAVLCTAYFPQFIWMAVIGRSYLNAERLAPLRGRSIVLFPDLSIGGRDYAYWQGKADNLRQQGFNIIVSDRLEHLASDEDRGKGYDLADYLLEHWKGYPQSWDTPSTSPASVVTSSTNRPLAEALAKCMNLPIDAVPLYQFTRS